MSKCVYEVYNKTFLVKAAVEKAAKEAVTKAAFDTEARAKALITDMDAVDTGAARASIYSSVPGDSDYAKNSGEAKGLNPHAELLPEHKESGGSIMAYHGICAVGVNYGYWINYGSHGVPARPFFDQAVEEIMPHFESFMTKALKAKLSI